MFDTARIVSLGLVGLGCLAIALLFKIPGLFAAGIIMAVALWIASRQPDSAERASLIDSIHLAAEDLSAIISEFEDIAEGQSTDAIAQRTLHRPALVDFHSQDPDIQAFHLQYKSTKRYLARLDTRIAAIRSNSGLEKLLRITDERCMEFTGAWNAAYTAAAKLQED